MSKKQNQVTLLVPSNSIEDTTIQTELSPEEAKSILIDFVKWMERHGASDMGAVTQIGYGRRYKICIRKSTTSGFHLEHDVGNSSVARHFVDKVLLKFDRISIEES